MNLPCRILYAEDEDSLRDIICELLTSEGFDCTGVPDGFEAKELLQHQAFDLLITDFNMPKMNGADLLFWCRNNGIHIPVIFMTANVERLPQEEMALGDCCASLLQKPVSFDVLLASIEHAQRRNHDFECHGKVHAADGPGTDKIFPGQQYLEL